MTGHDHDHERTAAPMVDEITDFEVLEIALRELCIEKGIFTAEEHRHFTEFAEQIGPTPAAHLVARAWISPEFKKLVLADPLGASKKLASTGCNPRVSEHRVISPRSTCSKTPPTLHHVNECTLFTSNPRPILGNSPDRYRTPNFRRRIVRWPRQVLAEFGLYLPEDVEIRVEDSNQKHRFMVMPVRPGEPRGWTEDQLVEIITRDCLIGVALPNVGVTTNAVTKTRPAIHPADQ